MKIFKYPGPSDISSCRQVVLELHNNGLVHKDLNRYNFSINHEEKVYLYDFDSFEKINDTINDERVKIDLGSLADKLEDTFGIGKYE